MHPFSNAWLILTLWKSVKVNIITYQTEVPLVMKNIIFRPVAEIVLVGMDCFSPLTLHNCDEPC